MSEYYELTEISGLMAQGCPFCGGTGGEYISEKEAQRVVLERKLNER
jgi:hypothetical protein